MEEKAIFKLSVIMIVLGMILLFFYAQELNLKVVESLELSSAEETIKIEGIVERLTKTNKTYFLQITGYKPETMDILLFPKSALYLKEGDYVEVQGQVEEYQGKKEVIADEIKIR